MYGIDGTRRLPEYELPWLPRYEGASPVRVGNDAAGQVQGDVPGEMLGAAHVGRTAGIVPMERGWELQRWLAGRLRRPGRGPTTGSGSRAGRGSTSSTPRSCAGSRLTLWSTASSVRARWSRGALAGLRDEIHADVLEKGYDAGRGTFTQAYGSKALDACALLIPRVGFCPTTTSGWSVPSRRSATS